MKVPKATIFIALICMTIWFSSASHSEDPSSRSTPPATPPQNSSTSTSPQITSTTSPFLEKAKHEFDTAQRRYDEVVLGQSNGYHVTIDDVMTGRISETEIQHRPFLYFRLWANRPLRIVPMSLFVFVMTLVLGYAMKSNFAVAHQTIRRQFWRCFGQGFITILIVLSFVRPLYASVIGTPLAQLLVGLVELLLLIGLAATVILIGETCLKRTGLADKFGSHDRLYRLSVTTLGSIFVGLIMALPGIGMLPPVGIRLVLYFCILGSGGLLRSKFGTKPLSSAIK